MADSPHHKPSKVELTPSHLKRANKTIGDYLLKFGYNETLDCFKKEADFPEADPKFCPDEIRIEFGISIERNPVDADVRCRFPFFLLTISLVQICTHIYMALSVEDYVTKYCKSPLIQDPHW